MSAPEKVSTSGVSYTTVDQSYFEKRTLRRSAGFWGIWGIGVAAVISGDFSGWNGGIASAGWGGLLIATVFVALMFFGLFFSIGEMSAAMPHTGGAYSFARAAMGPWGGFVTGLAESIEYVMTTAVVVYYSGQYADAALQALTGASLSPVVWWAILYVVFVALNTAGASVGFKFAIVVSIVSIAILVLFAILAAANGALDFGSLFDVKPDAGASAFLPHGVHTIFFALPFAIWFFLGIEELPLAAEETHNPARDIPRGGVWGLVSLMVCAAIVLFLNPAVLGADTTGASGQPLLDGFASFLPKEAAAILSIFALLGLLASLQGIMYAYGRNMYSLSRAGYYPKFLSLTGATQTPWVALIVGGVIGFAALFIVQYSGSESAGAVVLNISVWGAVIAYVLQMTSFLLLRRKFPNAKRPWKSPWGVPGAVYAGVIALISFVALLFNPSFQLAIVIIAIVFVLGVVLFALFGRTRLILSPEEEYALSGGLHGDPATEDIAALQHEVVLEAEESAARPD
ncbi:amino acid permease [Gryllotalpicola ginsengisoli]|uniref:amino acid permease n=1 Tax=Gryllotalpicola ginsengisoli TaxID=444608 RepID=UPI0003B42B75|nr:amino acid permease [Gryllotalpicola ginsengisoli]